MSADTYPGESSTYEQAFAAPRPAYKVPPPGNRAQRRRDAARQRRLRAPLPAEVVIGAIVNCARCGADHEDLTARAFVRPPSKRHTHYATCPNTEQPILVGIAVVG